MWYMARYDAISVSAPKTYNYHRQSTANNLVSRVIDTFPFRIQQIRTDNGSEFQVRLDWHVEAFGIRHARIKPSSPQLKGKMER